MFHKDINSTNTVTTGVSKTLRNNAGIKGPSIGVQFLGKNMSTHEVRPGGIEITTFSKVVM